MGTFFAAAGRLVSRRFVHRRAGRFMWGVAVALLGALAILAAPAAFAQKTLSPADQAIYQRAFSAAERGRWDEARRIAAGAREKLPGKVIAWMEMGATGNTVPFPEIARFIDDNPDWPGMDRLRRRAEEAIDEATPAKLILAWFGKREPLTVDGRTALARALIATGRTAEGRALIRRAWVEGDFNSRQEVRFLKTYRKEITEADDRARLDRLLWDGKHDQAERMIRRVPPEQRPLAIARLRLRTFHGGADAAIRRLPKEQLSDGGLLYERLRWRRRKGRDDDAMEVLRNAPKEMARPDRWWTERAVIARRMLAKGNVSDAYRAVADHGLSPEDTESFAEAEWMAGWIALRFLDEKDAAFKRFTRLHDAVRTPTSRARAAYWAGRAAAGLGRDKDAQRWYATAAKHAATYYGQLAAHHASADRAPTRVPTDPRPDRAKTTAFDRLELVRAARMLHELGQRRTLEAFVLQTARISADPAHKALAGRLARAIGRVDLGVRLARTAYRDGVLLLDDGYPVFPMPDGRPERALLLAVARQESNFSVGAQSHAGARGIMQLMPATAKGVAKQIKESYSPARLTSDPQYNVRLGRAYLGMMLDQFNGSYVLALGAYNAGPANVGRWIRAYGDPRDTQVDVVDWIEMIPYTETRNYVQRVLANLQVYRQRLGATQLASMEQDLRR